MAVNSEALLYPAAPIYSGTNFDEATKVPVTSQPTFEKVSKVRAAQAKARAVAHAASRGSLWLQLLFFACADPVITCMGSFLVWFGLMLSVFLLPLCCLGIPAFHIPLNTARAFSNLFAWTFRAIGVECPALERFRVPGTRSRCIAGLVEPTSWRAVLYVALVRPLIHYLVWSVMKILVTVAFAGLLMPVVTAVLRGVVGHASAGVAIGGLVIGAAVLALALCAAAVSARVTAFFARLTLSHNWRAPVAAAFTYQEIEADSAALIGTSQAPKCSPGKCIGKTCACVGLALCTFVLVAICLVISFGVYGAIACHSAVIVNNSTAALDLSAHSPVMSVDALEAGGPIARWLGVRVELLSGAAAAATLLETAVPAAHRVPLFAGRVSGGAYTVGPSGLRLPGGCVRALLQDIAMCPRATVQLTVPVTPPAHTSINVVTHGKIKAKECCGETPLDSIVLNTTRGCVSLGATSGAGSVTVLSKHGKVKTGSITGTVSDVLLASQRGRVKAAHKEGERIEASTITIKSGDWRGVRAGILVPKVLANVSARGEIEIAEVRLATAGARAEVHSRMGDVTVDTATFTAAQTKLAVNAGGWWGDAEVVSASGFTGNFTVCSRLGDATFGADADRSDYRVAYDQREDSCIRGRVARAAGAAAGMELTVQARGGDASVDLLL